jgi:hypothetical protein
MRSFGELMRLSLRDVWAHEASVFTPWLADNISELGAALGMELELVNREAAVGDFSVDLVAKDLGTGRMVIIENQITPTDHDHLGKLLTYAAGFDAYAVVWIAESLRDEHRQALDWLNQRTDDDTNFFGVVVEVLQIDDSKPAYNFRPVVFPNQWQKVTHPRKPSAPSHRGEAYRAFFQQLIDELRESHHFTTARLGQPQSWYTFASGTSGIVYGTCFAQRDRARVEVYIDLGDAVENKRLFDWLAEQKVAIEAEYGEPLAWERLDDRRASRIADYRPGSIVAGDDELAEIRSWMIERVLRMKQVFGPYLKKYMAGQKGERAPA